MLLFCKLLRLFLESVTTKNIITQKLRMTFWTWSVCPTCLFLGHWGMWVGVHNQLRWAWRCCGYRDASLRMVYGCPYWLCSAHTLPRCWSVQENRTDLCLCSCCVQDCFGQSTVPKVRWIRWLHATWASWWAVCGWIFYRSNPMLWCMTHTCR